MQVEQPHHAPATVGEFLRQYAMIVLSILTALALEHFAVSMQNRSDAVKSRSRIETELAANLRELRETSQSNVRSDKAARDLLAAVVDQLKAGTPSDQKIEPLLQPVLQGFQIAVPSWRHSAWDGAIADQSAGHLPAADLHRYSEIYASAADMAATWQVLIGGEWLTHATEILLDRRLGKLDARSLASTLARYLLAEQQIRQSEDELATLITGGQGPATSVR